MDMRDAVFNEICEIAKNDKDVILLIADVDAFGIKRFKKDFPDRFFNIGVAEQNMVNVASGLALSGKKVFICALAPFATFRCFEQIKNNICEMGLPVFIIGLGIGLSFGFDGPTHHTICDIGVMSNLPEMSIYNPSDSVSAKYCVKNSYLSGTPSYIRIDKGEWNSFYDDSFDFAKGFSVLQIGSNSKVIISTGICSQYSMSFFHECKVIDLFKIKPINKKDILIELNGYEDLIIYEEHVSNTGIGSIISNLILESDLKINVKKIALPEKQIFSYGDRQYLHNKYKISSEFLLNLI